MYGQMDKLAAFIRRLDVVTQDEREWEDRGEHKKPYFLIDEREKAEAGLERVLNAIIDERVNSAINKVIDELKVMNGLF